VAAVAVVAAVAEGVSAAAAVEAGVSAAAVAVGVSAEGAGVSAGDHQVVVHREEAVLGVSVIQAAGLQLPEATAGAAARVAMIAEAGRERGTGAAFRRREPGVVAHDRRHVGGVRKHGQSGGIHAQRIATSAAMM
jgi:hypothetical protein